MGWYIAWHSDKVVKLILYAPPSLRNTSPLSNSGNKLGLPHCLARGRQAPIAPGGSREQEDRSHSGGRVRSVGRRDLRYGSGGSGEHTACAARAQWRGRGRTRLLHSTATENNFHRAHRPRLVRSDVDRSCEYNRHHYNGIYLTGPIFLALSVPALASFASQVSCIFTVGDFAFMP